MQRRANEEAAKTGARWQFVSSLYEPLRRIGARLAGLAAMGAVLGGLTGYWTAYKAVLNDWIGQKQVMSEVPRLSIAVLPFENLTGDPAQDFFGDAVVDNLTTDLSARIPEAVVIASESSLGYKNRPIDPVRIGKQLNVRYLLTGSVLRMGAEVRINARLIDSQNSQQLWADRFEGTMADLLSLQDQVTSRISNSLQFTLPAVSARRTQKPDNQDAFETMLRGQVALNDERRRGINPRRQAESYFRRALLLEPDNPRILTSLGLVVAENLFNSRLLAPAEQPSPDQASARRSEASELIEKATRLVPATSDARLARALLSLYDHNFEDAQLQLERARSINPSDYTILYFLCLDYEYVGRPDKALPIFSEIYLRTAGRVPAYHIILLNWGRALLLLGRWSDALAKLKEAHALRPSPATSGALSIAYVQNGNLEMARIHFASWRDWHVRHFGVPTIKGLLASYRVSSGAPAYLTLVDATVLDGYRKLGVSED